MICPACGCEPCQYECSVEERLVALREQKVTLDNEADFIDFVLDAED